MELLKRIEGDLKEAMLRKADPRLQVLRLLLNAIRNKEIELRPQKKELTEEMVIEVINREVKKRKESIEFFVKGDRQDLADKEKKELEILSSYLPEMLSDDKIREIVMAKIKESSISEPQNFGKIMGLVMKEVKGRADGSKATQIVKEELIKIEKQ